MVVNALEPVVVRHELTPVAWTLLGDSGEEVCAAEVPGSVHLDLLHAGLIPDPFYQENEAALSWIGERNWTYRGVFEVDGTVLDHTRVLFRFLGLDTLAIIELNGQPLLNADNMHRTWTVDVSGKLCAGENEILVAFRSPKKAIRSLQEQRALPGWYSMVCMEGVGWLRKELCNFGWDWGPALVTAGIWRPIELIADNGCRLGDVTVRQQHSQGQVRLSVTPTLDGEGHGMSLSVRLVGPSGNQVAGAVGTPGESLDMTIADPLLWWPAGHGEQPLYTIVTHLTRDGLVIDTDTRRIGLRTIRLVREPDADGESFGFACNSQPFFAKGANWIPVDAVLGRGDETVRGLLEDARAAHMNMIRVWGGGLYESDAFYEICDELGLCVWQDLAFACVTFPGFESSYVDSTAQEVADNIRRLRHHASLALWCGNNEMEMGLVADEWTPEAMSWADYTPFMDHIARALVYDLDPEHDYWPSSSHTPGPQRRIDANHPSAGDAHLWAVWHGGRPATDYRTSTHRFVSEFGFQSLPHPSTVETYTEPSDRCLTSPVMDAHQKAMVLGEPANAEIARQLALNFRTAPDWLSTVWQTQILQAEVVRTGLEHWRRQAPRTMGALYWQLNDCWPGPSWSSIDYAGHWKALHFAVRRAFTPLMLSIREEASTAKAEIHLSNDGAVARIAEVEWVVARASGMPLRTGSTSVKLDGRSNVLGAVIDASAEIAEFGQRDVLIWASLLGDDDQTRVGAFVPLKHLSLSDPKVAVHRDNTGLRVTVEAAALFVTLDCGPTPVEVSDNFFHMRSGSRQLLLARDQDVKVASLYELSQH